MAKKLSGVNELKVGGYVIFDDVAYVIKSMQSSKSGKHGHAKYRIEAVSMLDSRKVIKVMPAHDKVEVPIVEKKAAQVLSVANDKANVMDKESYETFDIDIPEEFKDDLKEGKDIMYWIILDQKIIKQVR